MLNERYNNDVMVSFKSKQHEDMLEINRRF